MPVSARARSGANELQGDAVHAVAKARGPGTIVEDVAEMPSAPAAMHFRADHEELTVGRGPDRALDGIPEAGPARAAVELRVRGEKWQVTARAEIGAAPVLLVERARPRMLRPVLAQHPELLGRQEAAPLRLRLADLECLRRRHESLRSFPDSCASSLDHRTGVPSASMTGRSQLMPPPRERRAAPRP